MVLNPLTPPVTVTAAPGAGVKVIGSVEVPELAMGTIPVYDPAATCAVSPAVAAVPPLTMLQYGCTAVPGPVSEQEMLNLSTSRVVPSAGTGYVMYARGTAVG